MAWPRARYRTAEPGGAWGFDAMNGIQDWLTRPNGLVPSDFSVLDLTASHRVDDYVGTPWTQGVSRPIEDVSLVLATAPGALMSVYGEAMVARAGTVSTYVLPSLGVRVNNRRTGEVVDQSPWRDLPSTSVPGEFKRLSTPLFVCSIPSDFSGTSAEVTLMIRSVGTGSGTLGRFFRQLWAVSYAF